MIYGAKILQFSITTEIYYVILVAGYYTQVQDPVGGKFRVTRIIRNGNGI